MDFDTFNEDLLPVQLRISGDQLPEWASTGQLNDMANISVRKLLPLFEPQVAKDMARQAPNDCDSRLSTSQLYGILPALLQVPIAPFASLRRSIRDYNLYARKRTASVALHQGPKSANLELEQATLAKTRIQETSIADNCVHHGEFRNLTTLRNYPDNARLQSSTCCDGRSTILRPAEPGFFASTICQRSVIHPARSSPKSHRRRN